ncbi:MAG: extracellular solute-binding protein [Spirochaetota bacterium]|nr:MAG: extracellular solute-binding protein [Spirochaetota bacterium]
MIKRKKFVIALAVFCAVTMISASVSFAVDKPEEGELSGTIRMIGWEGYDFPRTFAEFGESNGVTVTMTYIASNDEIFAKLKAGAEYDIATPNQANVEQLVVNDLLQPIDTSRIPNYKNLHPLILKAFEQFNYQGKIWGVPCAFGKNDFVYSAERVDCIESWWDVLKPEWQGRYIMLDDALGQITQAARAIGITHDPSLLNPEEFEQVRDLLIKMKKGARAIVSSFGEAKSMLISGEADGWFSANLLIAGEAKEEGYDIWGCIPKEGTLIFLDSYVIPKNAPNLDGAYALINQMLSTDTQIELAEMYMGCVTKDAPPLLSADLYSYIPYDNLPKFFSDNILNGPVPLEPGEYATMDDWVTLWEEVKATK